MNYVSTNTYWNTVDRIPKKYDYLSDNIECDVAIIGAGITGAACAYYFAEAGIDTVILDKNIIAYGSTRASTSILQYEIDANMVDLKESIGIDNAVTAFKLCEKALYDIKGIVEAFEDNCAFEIHDCLYFADNNKDASMLKEEYKLRKQNGFDVEFFDEEKSKEKFPFKIKSGIYSKGLAGEIDPFRFTHALINSSHNKGLRVYENTEVLEIKNVGTYKLLTTKNEFTVKAKKVIIAEGYESRKHIDKKIVSLSRTFAIVTEPVDRFDEWYSKCVIRDTNDTYTYIRPTKDNRIIIGGEDITIRGEHGKAAELTNDAPASLKKYEKLQQKLEEFFPSIKGVKIEYRFSGVFGDTNDTLPYFGEYKGIENTYFNLSYGANGILYAILGGQFLRDLYLGNGRKELGLFSFER